MTSHRVAGGFVWAFFSLVICNASAFAVSPSELSTCDGLFTEIAKMNNKGYLLELNEATKKYLTVRTVEVTRLTNLDLNYNDNLQPTSVLAVRDRIGPALVSAAANFMRKLNLVVGSVQSNQPQLAEVVTKLTPEEIVKLTNKYVGQQ